jgi:glycerophosphoryl diester phosphodiesterase
LIRYPRIIAHRCGGALAMENSLAGLEAAARLGCRAVEFDVMLTADRVPILMHDETLDRTTRCRGRVAELDWAAIRAGDAAVPTLAEAVAACRRLGLWANIELKPAAGHEEATGAVVGAWLAAHWDGKGVVSSFSEKSALAARCALPDAAFAMLWERLPADWQAVCARLGAAAVHLDARHARAAAARLNAAGLPWACYTVNGRAAAERLFALGCAAVFTDRPDRWRAEEM